MQLNDVSLVELTREIADARREPTHNKLMLLAETFDLRVIDPFFWLCNVELCGKFKDEFGYLRYKDYDHLSLEAIQNEITYIHQIFE